MEAKQSQNTRIVIEPAFFGDFFIGVYDKNNNLVLDKKYFVRGKFATLMCANAVKEDLYPDSEILMWNIEEDKEVLCYAKKQP